MKVIEAWVTEGATGAKLAKVEPMDGGADGRFALDVDYTMTNYGQLMHDRLLVFKPAIVSRRDSLILTGASRKHPIVLKANAYAETVCIKLPEGFDVDELPDSLKLDAPFGSYAAGCEVKDNHLIFTRNLTVRAMTIPAEQSQLVRGFFERIRAVEQAPVVLAKK